MPDGGVERLEKVAASIPAGSNTRSLLFDPARATNALVMYAQGCPDRARSSRVAMAPVSSSETGAESKTNIPSTNRRA